MNRPIILTPARPMPLARWRDPAQTSDIRRLDLLASLMDNAFTIPGLGIRFGLDSLIGLLPGLGDAATSLVSVYILSAAQRLGAPRITLARMTLNIAVDFVVGSIPLAGDLFDLYWKANLWNVELLRRHLAATPEGARRLRTNDRVFVALLIGGLVGVLVASCVAAYFLVVWIGSAFLHAFR